MQPNNEIDKLRRNWGRKPISGKSWRAGVTQRQLVVIMCAAALTGAVATMVGLFGPTRSEVGAPAWQCLDCGHEFASETPPGTPPPVECPTKCGGQAVRLHYRLCHGCGKYTLMSRSRLTEEGQRLYKAMKSRQQDRGAGGPESAGTDPPRLPVELQYWVEQPDGSKGWTGWIYVNLPEALEIQTGLKCSHCGAYLRRWGRSAKGKSDR